MAWRIVRQPDGLFARWSDVVDNFTHFNLTEGGVINVCMFEYSMGQESAKEKLRAAVEDWPKWKYNVQGTGHTRWDECLETVKLIHGKGEVKQVMSFLEDDKEGGDK